LRELKGETERRAAGEGSPYFNLRCERKSDPEPVKTVQILAMVMLALLYLGGMYGHLSGAAFPIVGTGNNVYDAFQGKATDPVHPTITECRHIPLVKSVVVSPLYAVDVPQLEQTEEFQVVAYPCFSSPLLTACPVSCCDRAPPHC
jgi:hypothetical protein